MSWLQDIKGLLQRPRNKQVQAGARAAQDDMVRYYGVQTLPPHLLAHAFAAADQGDWGEQYQLYGLIEQHDPHIYAELAKRRQAITGLGWSLQAPLDARQAELRRTTELEQMVRSIPRLEDAHYDLTDAIGKGLSALEIEWRTGADWVPRTLHCVPGYRLTLNRASGTVQYLRQGMAEPLEPGKWMIHEHRALSGYIERSALFRVLGWTYAYKAYNVFDMQRFLERYGMPLRLGRFPAGMTDQAQIDKLLRAVRNIGHDGAGIMPDNMQIEFLQARNRGDITDFLDAIQYWERKQSLAILGSTLTSQADGKSSTNALGKVHNEVRKDILQHDVTQLAPTLQQQLVQRINVYNGMFALDRCPVWTYDVADTPDQQALVGVFAKASALGMRIPRDWAHQELRIPVAAPDEPVLMRGAGGGSAPIMGQTTAAMDQAAPHEAAITQQIAAIVADADSFAAALQRIDDLAVNLDRAPLARQIAQALVTAQLAGHHDGVANG